MLPFDENVDIEDLVKSINNKGIQLEENKIIENGREIARIDTNENGENIDSVETVILIFSKLSRSLKMRLYR